MSLRTVDRPLPEHKQNELVEAVLTDDFHLHQGLDELWLDVDEVLTVQICSGDRLSLGLGISDDLAGEDWPEIGDDVPHEGLGGLVGSIDLGAIWQDLLWAIWQELAEAMVVPDQQPQPGYGQLRMAGLPVLGHGVVEKTEFPAAEELLEELEGALAPVGESKADYNHLVSNDGKVEGLTVVLYSFVELGLGLEPRFELVLVFPGQHALEDNSFFFKSVKSIYTFAVVIKFKDLNQKLDNYNHIFTMSENLA